MQLLVQMVSDVRGLVQDVDRKLDRMVPRPEFEQYQHGVAERFRAIDARIDEKQQSSGAADAKLDAKIDAVDARVDSQEADRNRNYRDLNAKSWLALVGVGLSVVGGLIMNAMGG